MTMMTRILLFLTGLSFAMLAATGTSLAANTGEGSGAVAEEILPDFGDPSAGVTGPVTLRESVYTDNDVILLGDVFINVGALAGKSIAYAPEPGETLSLGARWLMRVARYYDLDWQPRRADQNVKVYRDSHVIDHEQIMDAINMALLNRGYSSDMRAELVARDVRIHLPMSAQPDVAVEHLRVDERIGRFTVVLAAPAGELSAKRLQLAGNIYETMEVPVTTRTISVGEMIGPDDLVWKRMRASQVSADAVLSERGLIGMTPKRSLRGGDVVRSSHIEAPVLVPNKSLVIVSLEHPFMILTVQGRAMESGALGEMIRVRNAATNTILDAEVSGQGRAVVRLPSQVALNSIGN